MSAWVQGTSLDPCSCPHCHAHAQGWAPAEHRHGTSLRCRSHARGDGVAIEEPVHSRASACGSDQTLSSLTGPHHCAQPASPAVLVPARSPPLSSHAHGSVPAKGEIGQLQESRLTVGAPRAASEPVVGPSPSCLPWPTPLCRCMQPAPATTRAPAPGPAAECVHTAGSGPHCCLPWSLAGRPEGATEDPSRPCNHCYPPAHLAAYQGPHSCWHCEPQQPEWKRHHRPQPPPRATTCLHTKCPVLLDSGTQ